MSEWRPIDSAPKDGTPIIGWRFYPVAIRWRPDLDARFPWNAIDLGGHPVTNFETNGFVDGDVSLTHWQHLPDEPPQ